MIVYLKSNKNFLSLLYLAPLIFFAGCKKFVVVDSPRTEIVTTSVYDNDQTALASLNGIYVQMETDFGFASGGSTSLAVLAGLSADEFKNYSASSEISDFYTNTLDANNSIISSSFWQSPYQDIYYANAALEGLAASTSLTAVTKNQLEGEAKFIRAFCHFYLVNLFGDIPLVLSTDYKNNAVAARTATQQVYKQIIADLQDAENLLAADYSFSDGERIRPNKFAATALLSRVYLYNNDWKNAADMATLVISNPLYKLEPNLNNVFIKNSNEAIWQLMPVIPDNNTNEGGVFILTASPANVAISQQLLAAFEPGDMRKTNWVNKIIIGTDSFYFPYKYKIQGTGLPLTEYSMVSRLSEMYLIRGEARAEQNDIAGAQADINMVRNRGGLPNTTAADQVTLLNAVIHEREIELFSEWGHRWLDLKRTGRADAILGPTKSPDWKTTAALYPIPQPEILSDSKLSQNPGY